MFLKLTSTKGLYLLQLKIKFTLRSQTFTAEPDWCYQSQTQHSRISFNFKDTFIIISVLLHYLWSGQLNYFMLCNSSSEFFIFYFHIKLFLLHKITVLLAKQNRLLNLRVSVLVDSKKGFLYKQLILFCKGASKQMLNSKEWPFWIFLPILKWKTKNVSLTLSEPAEASRQF